MPSCNFTTAGAITNNMFQVTSNSDDLVQENLQMYEANFAFAEKFSQIFLPIWKEAVFSTASFATCQRNCTICS